MYWSISKPSSNAVLLQLRTSDQLWFLTKMIEDKQCWIILIACCYNPIISMKDNTYLQTGHRHEPRSVFSCRYDSRSKHCMCLHSWPRAGSIIRRNVIGHLSDTLMAVCSTPSSPFKLLLFVTLVKFRLTGKKNRLKNEQHDISKNRTINLRISKSNIMYQITINQILLLLGEEPAFKIHFNIMLPTFPQQLEKNYSLCCYFAIIIQCYALIKGANKV